MPYSRQFNAATYLTHCVSCGAKTSKSYAKAHEGKCKTCATGIERKANPRYTCPTCHRENALSEYQVRHHYHCDACTRDADPVGYANEVRGFYDGPDY